MPETKIIKSWIESCDYASADLGFLFGEDLDSFLTKKKAGDNSVLTKACNDKDEALKILSDKIKAKDNALRRIADYAEPMSLNRASNIARDALKHD